MSSPDDQTGGSGWRILIAGTGGQGVLTAARAVCDACVENGHQAVSGQLHGMAQRGGSVQASVIIDCGISPVIPSGRADFVVGFEPVETARALPLMSSRTVVYMNMAPVVPYVLAQRFVLEEARAEYPKVDELYEAIKAVTPHVLRFDATTMATEAGSAKTLNMIMLGCLLGSGALPCTTKDFWHTVTKSMPARLQDTNQEAFARGVELGKAFRHEVSAP